MSLVTYLESVPSAQSAMRRFARAALAAGAALVAATASGCGGCNTSTLECDDAGQCFVCDGYGCEPAPSGPSTSVGSAGGPPAGAGGQGGFGGEGGFGEGEGGSGGEGGSVEPACDPAVVTCACADDADCSASGQACVGGLCIDGCDFSYECGAGKVCINGACAPGCDEASPCAAGYACSKGACVPDLENPECQGDGDCGPGEACKGGFCSAPCQANADCPEGEICNAEAGACVPDPQPKPSCDDAVACTGPGQICGADGYCHYPCTSVDQCKLIDARFVACDTYCKTNEEAFPECTLDEPCEGGEDCVSNQCL